MAQAQALSYRLAKAVVGALAAGGAGTSLVTWHFTQDKAFREKMRSDYGQIAAEMDKAIGEYLPRTATKMRVEDECENMEGAPLVGGKAGSTGPLRPSVMPAMPGGILTSLESFSPENGLPEVVADDAASDSDDALQPLAAWGTRRVQGELADSMTVQAPTSHGAAGEESHVTLPNADMLGQLQWLRAKEALALEHLEAARARVREHKQRLATGFIGGGRTLMAAEREVRLLRRELVDLAEAKLSVKTYGVMR